MDEVKLLPCGDGLLSEAKALAQVVGERTGPDYGDGIWLTCSGCHESCDGYDVGHYPHSLIFNCKLGGGCSECGGIGAVWDMTDYEAMGRDLADEATRPTDEVVERVARALNRSSGRGHEHDWESYVVQARAAIAAMKDAIHD